MREGRTSLMSENLSDEVELKIFKCSEHVESMSGERLNRRVLESEVEGRRDKGRPCTRSLDRVEKAC